MTNQEATPERTANLLARYKAIVERYHGTLDLISKRGLAEFDRYVNEGLRYAALIERLAGSSPSVVDVGSGAGLPGVIIAIALPAAEVHLVERRQRRAAFLDLTVAQLELANVTVFAGDVRELKGVAADVITAQAVASHADLVGLTKAVRADPCWLISRRGPGWRDELGAAQRPAGTGPGGEGAGGTSTDNDWARTNVVEEGLEPHGSLVAIRLPGGSACRSSA